MTISIHFLISEVGIGSRSPELVGEDTTIISISSSDIDVISIMNFPSNCWPLSSFLTITFSDQESKIKADCTLVKTPVRD